MLIRLKGMGNEKCYFILNISFESTFKIIYWTLLLIFQILLSSWNISIQSNELSAILDWFSISLTMDLVDLVTSHAGLTI